MAEQDLREQFPIVNEDGTPTKYFMRFFQDKSTTIGTTATGLTTLQGTGITLGPGLTGSGTLSTGITIQLGEEHWLVAASDEATALTAGAAKLTFRVPFALTLTDVRANVNTAPTGAAIQVDINKNGVSALSTPITIDATEKTSVTAATPPVISAPDGS